MREIAGFPALGVVNEPADVAFRFNVTLPFDKVFTEPVPRLLEIFVASMFPALVIAPSPRRIYPVPVEIPL